MAKTELALSEVYGLLETGPVIMLSTAFEGKRDIMTQSWHTMIEFVPPLIGCVVSNQNDSFELLEATEECVINIPTLEIASQMVGCGNTHGHDIDKFARFGLTPVPAEMVDVPMIGECYANLECRVEDTTLVEQYGLFVLEVVKAWIDPTVTDPKTLHHRGYGRFMVAGETITLDSKMK